MVTQPPSPPNPGATSFVGTQDFHSAGSDYNAQSFLVRQILALINIGTAVEVMSVTNDGGMTAVGFVDVLPLVNQLDGSGNAIPHETIYGLPYVRLQGGANAVICDPTVGDIGAAIFADRDISSVKANKAQSNPGSRRRFSKSDGIYFGGILNGVPTQVIRFASDGIHVTTPNTIFLEGNTQVIGTLTATGNITAGQGGGDQVALQTHKHPTAAAGSPSSPTPGT